jgi:transposase
MTFNEYIALIMRYIKLKTEEIETLEQLLLNSKDNSVRKRSQGLLLSHQGRTIIDLANIFNVNRRTIERWFDDWLKNGVDSLSIQSGRGVRTRLKDYSSEVSQQLEHHNITICKKTLQNFLKDTGL